MVLIGVALASIAVAQEAALRIADLAASPDAEVRGEAALLLGALREDGARDVLRKLALDREIDVRVRAIVALGALDAPGADTELGRLLTDRDVPAILQQAAAYALGSLPDERAAPSIDEFLGRSNGGSSKRNRDAIAALLAGMQRAAHPSRRAQIGAILHDSSIRDPDLLAIALESLIRSGGRIQSTEVRRMLGLEDAELRGAVLRSVQHAVAPSRELHEELKRIARRDRDPKVRAAALASLAGLDIDAETRSLAQRALATEDADAVQAAVTVLSTSSGAEDRSEAAARIRTATPSIVVAVLRGWVGIPASSLVESSLALATAEDRRADDEALALHILASAREPRAEAMLVDFARRAQDPGLVADALRDLLRYSTAVDPLDVLGRLPADQPARLALGIESIGRVDPKLTSRLARDTLARADAPARAKALVVLRAWRRAVWPSPPAATLAHLDRDLARLLD